MTQAYTDVRILDFSQVIAGPFAAQLFNMLGATVIKVEEPTNGDQMRNLLPVAGAHPPGLSPTFMAYNFGKQSLAVNLKAADAREVILKLAGTCDVVVENFRAGVIRQLGFGYDDIRAVKPDIVYCSISGYGQAGPDSKRAAYDAAIQASAGMMASTGHPETGPVRATAFPIDISTGLTAAFAIASALYRRQRTGEGQYIDVAMQDTAMTLLSSHYARFLAGGDEPELLGNQSPSRMPTSDTFETADGHVMVATGTAAQATAFLEEIGLTDRLGEPMLADNDSRIANRAAVQDIILPIMKTRTSADWVARFEKRKIPAAKVRNVAEVARDPQLETRGILKDVPDPEDARKTRRLPTAAFICDADGPNIPGAPPKLGAETTAVLRSIGYSDDQIAALRIR
jgi:crotonobetainyl-CoA:carnitine CoA-transferase CaiB-like acyl-CoA transferase